MATFTKRGDKWRVQVFRCGVRQSDTFGSKAAALAWAGRIESEIIAGERGEIPNKTFGDLLERYAEKVAPKKKGARWELVRIKSLVGNLDPARGPVRAPDPITLIKLANLDTRAVADWRDRRQLQVASGTIRREWTLLSRAATIGVREWRWLRVNPFNGVSRPKPPEHRDRLASDAELAAVAAAARTPAEVKVVLAARWAVETGMRASEITGLPPEQVDTALRVARLIDTWADREKNGGEFTSLKSGIARDVALSSEAVRIWEESGGGFRMKSGTRDTYWRRLCKRAGVVNLHFHDLRHTACTRLAKKLGHLELARMLGIRDLKILLIYYNETAANIALKLD